MFNFEQLELVELLDLTFLFGTSEAISKILKPEITNVCAVEAKIKLHMWKAIMFSADFLQVEHF